MLSDIRRLRYKTLDHLVGSTVVVTGLDNLMRDLITSLGPGLRTFSLISTRNELAGCAAKYGFLDVTLASETPPANWEKPTRSLMRDLGFFQKGKRTSDRIADQSDPTCLSELIGNIDNSRAFMRLLLTCDSTEVWIKSRWKQALETSVNFEEATTRAFNQGMNDFEERLPGTFAVEDACLANSDFVWFHKHFWM